MRHPGHIHRALVAVAVFFVVHVGNTVVATAQTSSFSFRLTVTTPLAFRNVPMDPTIDFGGMIRGAKLPGVLDPNSIQVFNVAAGTRIPHVTTADFFYGDQGRIEWVIEDPTHVDYDIHFRIAVERPQFLPQPDHPMIGVGDLLRYNADQPRPITFFYAGGLVDLNGDGKPDLVGCWNYAYRPGDPWDGIICYPRLGRTGVFEFGDLTRIRHVARPASRNLQHFQHTYMAADFADFDRDGHVDLVCTRRGMKSVSFYLNTGGRDPGGMPIFTSAGLVAVSGWEACRAVDLNGDGSLDLVVDGQYVKNTATDGWPFQPAKPEALDAGHHPAFLDVDQDGQPDSVCLQGGPTTQPDGYRIAWRRNLGGDPPTFGDERPLDGIDLDWCTFVAPAMDERTTGLLVQHDVFQQISFVELVSRKGEKPRFGHPRRAESVSAVLSLGDQAWPCVCDWDADGDLDLLVGGGYGWPRIVVNEGSNVRPAYSEPKLIYANGQPIRFLRNEILGQPLHWHNMGYPYPVFVDWDDDNLPDLLCPNETNRVFWYKNIGTRETPMFGERRQIIVDGFPDSPTARRDSAVLAQEATYPLEEGRPFFWRTAAAFADWNGDGLMDLVTHDGHTRKATLFAQYRRDDGQLRLRASEALKLTDGRAIDDSIVGRSAHWTEGFRAIDWDVDGLTDLVYSCAGSHGQIQDNGSIFLLRNCGTENKPKFEPPVTMCCFGQPIRITNHGPNAWPCDLDCDGKPDLVTCVEWSVYPVYRYAALQMKSRPRYVIGLLTPR